jgi:hypothetical protein
MARKPTPSENVAQMPTRCCAEGCSQKAARMNFCSEHFVWFKEGLVNREGQRPSDFDKKYQAFAARHKKAA